MEDTLWSSGYYGNMMKYGDLLEIYGKHMVIYGCYTQPGYDIHSYSRWYRRIAMVFRSMAAIEIDGLDLA